MKHLVIVAIWLLTIANVWSQGTVNFTNETIDFSAPFGDMDGTPLPAGNRYMASLWVGADSGSLASVASTPFNIGGGIFDGGAVVVEAFPPGDSVVAQVRYWDTQSGAEWASAAIRGESNLISITLGGAGNPPSLPTDLVGLQATALVPEPSTFALGMLAVGAGLLARYRRK